MFTETMTQALAIPAADLPPLNRAANTATNSSGWIVGGVDMLKFRRVLGKVSTGVIVGSNCTCVLTFLASNTSNTLDTGNWAQVSSGPSVTLNANMAGTIEIRADQLPQGKRYVALLINNNCAALFQAELLCGEASYKPASDNNINTTLLQQAVCTI